jgi:DNA-binding FadR family transcriptional regulator
MQPGAMRDAYKHHKSIFTAIAGRDPDAAEEAMATHLMAVEKRFWKTAGAMRQRRENSTAG